MMFYARYKHLYITWVKGGTFAVGDVESAMTFERKQDAYKIANELGIRVEVEPCSVT